MWLKHAKIEDKIFKADYWRKAAVYLGNDLAVSALSECLSQHSLMALAGDELIESRLIQVLDDVYHLETGPFALTSLPSNSMLMLQTLESRIEQISELLTSTFGFIPRWRIDDVMATYGNEGANCGPHFDHYDVFLLQVRGEKTWRLDDIKHLDTDLAEDADIRLLNDFKPTQELLQRPGDILYIPPGIGHHGIASDDSLTLSIGIRNPTLQEMISHIADMAIDEISSVQTLDDSLVFGQADISPAATNQLAISLQDHLTSSTRVSRWFGQYMTELREPDMILPLDEFISSEAVFEQINKTTLLSCHLATRLSWQVEGAECLLFVNGECFVGDETNLGWFKSLVQDRRVSAEEILSTHALNLDLIAQWLTSGALYWDTNPRK